MIAADAEIDERMEPVFPAEVELKTSWLDEDEFRRELQLGMNATAEVKTGDRPIYDFILSPIARRRQLVKGEYNLNKVLQSFVICIFCAVAWSCGASQSLKPEALATDLPLMVVASEIRKNPYPANFEIQYSDIAGLNDCGELVPSIFLGENGVGSDLEVYLSKSIDVHFELCAISNAFFDGRYDVNSFNLVIRSWIDEYSDSGNICGFVAGIESEFYINECLYTDLVVIRTLGLTWSLLQSGSELNSLKTYFENSLLKMAESRLMIDSLYSNCRSHCSDSESAISIDASFQKEIKYTLSGIVCEINGGCYAD